MIWPWIQDNPLWDAGFPSSCKSYSGQAENNNITTTPAHPHLSSAAGSL